MMYFYSQFARTFFWAPSEVDEQEIEVVFDMLRVATMTREGQETITEKQGYIDEVLF